MEKQGILIGDTGKRTFRLVTHHDVDDEAVAACIEAFQKVMSRAV
jgi:threonine aldolase